MGAAAPGRPGAAHRVCQRREPAARARRRAAARIGRASGAGRGARAADAPAPGRKPAAGSHRRARSGCGRVTCWPAASTSCCARARAPARPAHRRRILVYTAAWPGWRPCCSAWRPRSACRGPTSRTRSRRTAAPLTSGHLRLPRLLVGAQMALCLTVLVAAGLLGRSLATLRLTDLGLRPHAHPVRVGEPVAGRPAGQPGRAVRRASASGTVGDPRRGARGDDWVAAAVGQFVDDRAHLPGRPYREDGPMMS